MRIPVDNSSFEAFYKLFNQYAAKLEEMPQEWQQLNEAMGGAGDALAKGAMTAQQTLALAAASTTAIVEAIALAAKEQDGFTRSTKAGTTAMSALGDKVKGVVSGVLELGRTVFKFGGIAGTLAGVGGAVGVADLAGAALTAQRSAAGMGLSVGQSRAFSSNMREYVGDNVLQGAAAAQVDPTKYGWLAALGINGQQAANENAAQLATQEINAVRAAWRANPSINTAQSQAALALGFSLSDIRNVGGANGAYLGQDEKNATDTSGLGFSAATAHRWATLSQTLNKAELTIQSALIDGLEPLAPMLTSLSKAASETIAAFLTSPRLKEDLTDFTTWLESPKFKKDVTDFISGFETLASKIKGWLQLFGILPSDGTSPGKTPAPIGMVPYDKNDPKDNWPPIVRRQLGLPPIDPTTIPGYQPPITPSVNSRTNFNAVMRQFEAAGYSKNFAAAMASQASSESDFGANMVSADGSHRGMFQWGSTRRAAILAGTGIDVWSDFNPTDQVKASIWELRNTEKKAAAIIAAQPSPQTAGVMADRYYERSGDSPIKEAIRGLKANLFYGLGPDVGTPNAPSAAPVQDKTAALLKRLIQQGIVKPAHITISNSTSAKVAVSANAAAHG